MKYFILNTPLHDANDFGLNRLIFSVLAYRDTVSTS